MNPCWTVRAWPPILWQARSAHRLSFSHLDTRVLRSGDREAPFSGQTLWAVASLGGDAGLAWDWIALPRGVVAMVDPMCVVTNLRLLGAEGEVLTAFQAARHLNELVHMLPWQTEVERAMSGALTH